MTLKTCIPVVNRKHLNSDEVKQNLIHLSFSVLLHQQTDYVCYLEWLSRIELWRKEKTNLCSNVWHNLSQKKYWTWAVSHHCIAITLRKQLYHWPSVHGKLILYNGALQPSITAIHSTTTIFLSSFYCHCFILLVSLQLHFSYLSLPLFS